MSTSFGIKENVVDKSIYIKISGCKLNILVLYVDDVLLARNDVGFLNEINHMFFTKLGVV